MGTNPILRATSNALAGNTLTNLAASSGQGLGALIESGDTETAWDVFLEALGKQEQENENIPMPLQMGANALSSTLPQSRILRGIDQAKNLIEGGGFLKDNSKQDVHVGQKKFPSTKPKGLEKEGKKQGLDNAKGVVLNLKDGHTATVERAISDKKGLEAGQLVLRNSEGKRYAFMNLERDDDGTITISSNFPMKEDMPESEALKMGSGKSKELRNILAKKLGGIGSDKKPTNSAAGIRSYYSDPNAKRVFPESTDTQSRVSRWDDYLDKPIKGDRQSRFFTPGSKQQANDFDVAIDAVYGGAPKTENWKNNVLPGEGNQQQKPNQSRPRSSTNSNDRISEHLENLSEQKQGFFDIGLRPTTREHQRGEYRIRAVGAVNPELSDAMRNRRRELEPRQNESWAADGMTQDGSIGKNQTAAYREQNADLDGKMERAGLSTRMNQPWDEFLSNLRPAQNMTPVPQRRPTEIPELREITSRKQSLMSNPDLNDDDRYAIRNRMETEAIDAVAPELLQRFREINGRHSSGQREPGSPSQATEITDAWNESGFRRNQVRDGSWEAFVEMLQNRQK